MNYNKYVFRSTIYGITENIYKKKRRVKLFLKYVYIYFLFLHFCFNWLDII